MELDMVANKEVKKVADVVAGHGCWLIRPKLLRPEPYPALRVYYVSKGSVKKKLWKSGQADRLGWPTPPSPEAVR